MIALIFVLEQQLYDFTVIVIAKTDLLCYIDGGLDALPQPSDPTQYRCSISL